MTALATTAPKVPALALPEQELIELLGSSLYPGATIPSIKMALGYCKASGLDPMQKPVHIVPMWDKNLGKSRDVIMPGIGLYRTQAARSGQLAGISEPEFGPEQVQNIGGQECRFPEWCRVTVRRELASGTIAEFTAVEYWLENYAVKGGKERSIAPNAMWTKRPRGQIAKCAQAQALRMAFPEIGAAPTAEEMEGKALDAQVIDVTPEAPPARAELPPLDDAKFEKNLPGWKKFIGDGGDPESVIATAGSRYRLTDEQKAEIRQLAHAAPEPTAEEASA